MERTDRDHGTTDAAAVSLSGVTKRYGSTIALHDVTLEIPGSGVYGLIGPNGAGKTTLLETLAGLRDPDAGTIERRGTISIVADTPRFERWLTATEVVALAATLAGAASEADHLDAVGLGSARDRRVGELSRGMAQRLGIAAALAAEPSVLICDEPTSALDPAGRAEINALLAAVATTRAVIISTHDLTAAAGLCNHVAVLAAGTLRYNGTLAGLADTSTPTIAVTATGTPEQLDAFRHTVEAEPWSTAVADHGDGRYLIACTDHRSAQHGIVAAAARTGTGLAQLTSSADLHTTYLQLVTDGAPT